MNKRRKKAGVRGPSPLERARRALEKALPVVVPKRGMLLLGSDALLLHKKSKGFLLRFWSGAEESFRNNVQGALAKARISYSEGPAYEIEQEGRVVGAEPIKKALREAAAGEDKTEEITFSKLLRRPHIRRCLACKELLDQVAMADDEYTERAVAAIEAHEKEEPLPDNIACSYSGCVHHEDMSRDFALKMVELGPGDEPWRNVRGVQVSAISLHVREGDAPEGWDFKATQSDVTTRHFLHLRPSAGYIYVRLGPKRTTAHVWISPPYPTRHETIEDPATIEDVQETLKTKGPAIAAWCRRKFEDLKALAQMDLGLEGGEKNG